jgi:hypothetical protein
MFRQICGAIAEYEKARLVARLKRAREQARIKKGGKCEGRKSHAEIRPDVVDLANRLRHARSGKQRSLREISRRACQARARQQCRSPVCGNVYSQHGAPRTTFDVCGSVNPRLTN